MSDQKFVVFSEEGGSCEIIEAPSEVAAMTRVFKDWDPVVAPGYKMYAVKLDLCESLQVGLTLEP